MVSKKKAKRKTQSIELETASLPKKGTSTMSSVDCGSSSKAPQGQFFPDFTPHSDRIIKALEDGQEVTVVFEDKREPDKIMVEPNIKVEPFIKVEPTPIEIKVPTQRIPEMKPPVVTVKNEISLTPLYWLVSVLLVILATDVGLKIWQLTM